MNKERRVIEEFKKKEVKRKLTLYRRVLGSFLS